MWWLEHLFDDNKIPDWGFGCQPYLQQWRIVNNKPCSADELCNARDDQPSGDVEAHGGDGQDDGDAVGQIPIVGPRNILRNATSAWIAYLTKNVRIYMLTPIYISTDAWSHNRVEWILFELNVNLRPIPTMVSLDNTIFGQYFGNDNFARINYWQSGFND